MVVDKKGCKTAQYLSPRQGGAANGFHQMGGSHVDSSKLEAGYYDFVAGTMKDLCSGKESRKISSVWKFHVNIHVNSKKVQASSSSSIQTFMSPNSASENARRPPIQLDELLDDVHALSDPDIYGA